MNEKPPITLQDWEKRRLTGLEKQLDQVRTRYPQAHYEPPTIGKQSDYKDWLIVVPGFELIEGWNASICTVLIPIYLHTETAGPLNGFFVDLFLKLANGGSPHHSRNSQRTIGQTEEEWENSHWIAGRPQWKNVTRFWWKAQGGNPNHDTIYTAVMLVKRRLKILE